MRKKKKEGLQLLPVSATVARFGLNACILTAAKCLVASAPFIASPRSGVALTRWH
jgi:hypothetical protein